MKKMIIILSLVSSILVIGCSSTKYTYYEKPSSIKKGVTKYYLKNIKVNLSLGNGAIDGDKSFANQDELTGQFNKSLTQHLIKKKILASSETDSDAVLEITINFTRTFNWGGKALNKPKYSYSVDVKKNEKLLVSYGVPEREFTHGNNILDMPYNAKIAAFQRGAGDESRDVASISENISEEIAEIGN